MHLVCTLASLPITWALANPKVDEQEVLTALHRQGRQTPLTSTTS